MDLTRKKEQAREADQLRVERGEITRDELQAENSIIPMELANDPEWKAKRLAAAAASMNRPRPKLIVPAKVIDCLRLLESKTISLNTLDESQRQDRKHLMLCCAALREILKEGAKAHDPAGLITTANRVLQSAEFQLGLDTLKNHNIDLLDSIPWEPWKNSKHPELKEFAEQEETIRSGIQGRIDEAKELKEWLASLNPKTPPVEPSLG